MREPFVPGQILTFYSFKGGVGRTMALANVAFLAACGGFKVLVMDWDLEAPGLDYYFRGMRESAPERQDQSRGVLDVLWDWCTQVDLRSAAELRPLAQEYRSGAPFAECVRPLVDDMFLASGGRLDFIGSGSARIDTPATLPYGEALAKFSWTSFFDNMAGGVVIEGMKSWAKANYDLILIDSRTGLADVAGLCTMQIPDQVALCFILNRQNIDGTAQVAAAIRARRGDAVRVRAVPMRVASKQSSEESDARVRAVTALCKVGGMNLQQVSSDIGLLDIAHADNVPFYEALAPFVVARPGYDPLTLSYLRLANELLYLDLKIPDLDARVVDRVRERLQPRAATIAYIRELRLAEPARATEELGTLLSGAQAASESGIALSEAYVRALVDAVFAIARSHLDLDVSALQEQAVVIVRQLAAEDQAKWSELLLTCIDYFLGDDSLSNNPERELELYQEMDSILQHMETHKARMRRASVLGHIATAHYLNDNNEQALSAVSEWRRLIQQLRFASETVSVDEDAELMLIEIQADVLLSDVLFSMSNRAGAVETLRMILARIQKLGDGARAQVPKRILSRIHQTLAFNLDVAIPETRQAAVFHALAAIRQSTVGIANLLRLSSIVVEHGSESHRVELAHVLFGPDAPTRARRDHIAFAQTPAVAIRYLLLLGALAMAVFEASDKDAGSMMRAMADSATQVLRIRYRRGQTERARLTDELEAAASELHDRLLAAGIDWQPSTSTETGESPGTQLRWGLSWPEGDSDDPSRLT